MDTLYRDFDGKLPAYAWPGGYQMFYLMSDGEVMCPDCANGENGSHARTEDGPDDAPHDGWKIVAGDIHWEGPPEICCHCNAEIPSSYGDPNEDERE